MGIRTLGLDHVALVFPDLEAGLRLCRDALALPISYLESPRPGSAPIPFAHAGRTRIELLGRRPELEVGIHHLAFAVGRTDQALVEVEAAGLRVASPPRTGAGGSTITFLEPVHGVRIQFVEQRWPLPKPERPPDPFVERIDHVGVASAANDAYRELFAGTFGFPVESQQTDAETRLAVESFTSDRYGIVVHNRPAELVGGLRVLFITVSDCELEFLQDVNPALGAAGRSRESSSTRQDQSAIARWVDRRGPGLHHLAFKVPDIDAALARMEQHGAELLDRRGRPGSRRALIGFMHPKSTGGTLLHFVQRDDSWPDRNPNS